MNEDYENDSEDFYKSQPLEIRAESPNENSETDGAKDELSLKWGTLKSWNLHGEKAEKLLREYHEIGASFSAAMQHDTPRQKEIICELIDIGNFDTVYLDWDGIEVSKHDAKKYVMEYGKNK